MIHLLRHGDVQVLRLDRPPVNALDVDLLDALTTTMTALEGPVVLTGSGRVFSAGVDLRQVLAADAGDPAVLIAALAGAFRVVFDHPGPTVAAINGSAIAGGCVLALACDVRLMAAGRIGLTELAVGVPFPLAALEIVRYALGATAHPVVLRAETFDPEEAVSLGLIDERVGPDELLDRANAIAAQLQGGSAETYALIKGQLHRPVVDVVDVAAPGDDRAAAAIWGDERTRRRIGAQLAALSNRRPDS
jgi:enoyl-CoA hydratase